MKKSIKALIACVLVLASLWACAFTTDLVRCHQLKSPVFARASVTADDGGSGTYKGLGWKIEIEKHIDAEYGVKTDYIEMRLFGMMVFAVIVD